MNRGDIVIVAARGAYSGKPRPALIVQSNLFNETHASFTLCLITSDLQDAPLFRVPIDPSASNGLRDRSEVMIDKMFSAPRANLGSRVGSLAMQDIRRVDDALRLWLQV